jgi:hypothetical protein
VPVPVPVFVPGSISNFEFRISNFHPDRPGLSFEFLVLSFEFPPLTTDSVPKLNSEFGNRRRQRSELRPHPKEEAMSHALATVLRDGRRPSAIQNSEIPSLLLAGETPAPQSSQDVLWGSRPGCRPGGSQLKTQNSKLKTFRGACSA